MDMEYLTRMVLEVGICVVKGRGRGKEDDRE